MPDTAVRVDPETARLRGLPVRDVLDHVASKGRQRVFGALDQTKVGRVNHRVYKVQVLKAINRELTEVIANLERAEFVDR